MPDIGQELLNVPFPDMVRSLAGSIAQAQLDLDLSSMRIAQMMAGTLEYVDGDGVTHTESKKVSLGGKAYSLLELGFTPTFYQFTETIIEVRVSITMMTESSARLRTSATSVGFSMPSLARASVQVASVSATYSNRYQYSAEGSSLIRTKLVPIPAPAVLEERIRALLKADLAASNG